MSRIRTNLITNRMANGAPTVSNGLVISGVTTSTSFSGDGSQLTSLPAQATIANNADNRVITGGSGVNLNGESTLTYDGTNLDLGDGKYVRLGAGNDFQMWHNGGTGNTNIKQVTGHMYFYTGSDLNMLLQDGTSVDLYYANNKKFETTNTGATLTGNLKFATSGNGIDFSATSNSSGTMENELLDDYEEGTWTPVYQNVNTPSYGHRSGRYTKIGRFVYLVCQISVDSGLDTSDGSTVNIGGFPFTGNNAHGSCLFTLGQYIDVMPDSTIDLFTNVRFNGNSVLLHEGRNNQDITYTQLNSSGNLQFACSYAL